MNTQEDSFSPFKKVQGVEETDTPQLWRQPAMNKKGWGLWERRCAAVAIAKCVYVRAVQLSREKSVAVR